MNDANAAVDFILNTKDSGFVQIPDWPEYAINTSGVVIRLKKSEGTHVGRVLRWNIFGSGYAKVGLCRSSKRKEFLVHRLVAITFIGDPSGFDVCHHDGDKLNNCLSNLRIDTRTGNMADQIRMGKTPRGEKSGSNVYSKDLIIGIKLDLKNGMKVTEIHARTGIPKPTLYGIRCGQTWAWL